MNFHCIFVLVNAFLFFAPICRRKNGTESSPIIRWLFGTNITPKTRRMHAEKGQFSAPDRRRIGANFKAATEFRCRFGANSVPVFRRAWNSTENRCLLRFAFWLGITYWSEVIDFSQLRRRNYNMTFILHIEVGVGPILYIALSYINGKPCIMLVVSNFTQLRITFCINLLNEAPTDLLYCSFRN